MKELIILNISLLIIYFIVSYKLISEDMKNAFSTGILSKTIIIAVIPIAYCFTNQIFILFMGLDRKFIWFAFLYFLPPIISLLKSKINQKKSEKFYNKYHDNIINYTVEYLKKNNISENSSKVIVVLNCISGKLGTHKIILYNVKEDKLSIDELKAVLFKKYNLLFDIYFKNK